MVISGCHKVSKVVFLCDFFSSLGGTEIYNSTLVHGLIENGIKVRVYSGEKPKLKYWQSMFKKDKIFFKTPNIYHKDLSSNTIEKKFINEIVDEINEWKPDIIHVHPFKKMAIQWLLHEKSNKQIPIISTEWTVPRKNASHWFEPETKLLINRVDAYISTCDAITNGLRNYHGYNGAIVKIPHIIKYKQNNKIYFNKNKSKSVGCISRLSTEKGLVFLIGAWSRIIEKFPNHTLHIYGHGPEETSLKNLRDCLGLQDSIFFEGTYEPGTVNKIAKLHNIFVQPSLFESIPTSIIELMINGVAIIASDVGGISELIHDGENGLICTPGSTDSIVSKLSLLLSSPALVAEYSQEAFKNSHDIYNYDKILSSIIELYDNIMSTKNAQ